MSRQPISYPIPSGFSVAGPSGTSSNGGVSSPPASNGYDYSPRPSLDSGHAESSTAARRPSGQRAPRGPSGASTAGAIDSHVTRLLVHTKQILQAVTAWGQGEVSEEGVSEIFVRLGNEFTNCIVSFRRAGVAVDELKGIPDKLRAVLERCLAEEPSVEVVNLYIPTVRNIIFELLTGLKQKQAAYKRLMTERSATPPPAVQLNSPLPPPPPIDPPSASRLSARSFNSSQSLESVSPASADSALPQQRVPSSQALAERARAANRPAPPDAFRPPRRVPSDTQSQPAMGTSPSNGTPTVLSPRDPHIVRHQLVDNPVPMTSTYAPAVEDPRAPPPKPIPHPDRFSRDSLGRHISRFSADSEITHGSPARSTPADSPRKPLVSLVEDDEPQGKVSLAPSLPTLNLPSADLDFGDSSNPSPSLPDVTAETRRTLAALGRSDALERRASKRFSSYTFNKLPGSPSQKKLGSADSPQRPTRRADRPPPLPSLPETLPQSNLGLAAPIGQVRSNPIAALSPPSADQGDLSSSPRSIHTNRSDTSESQEGSVRIVKTPEPDEVVTLTPRPGAISPVASSPTSISIFLQIGRHVKKTRVDLPVSFSSLRLLFMDKFDYDPGVDNFPDVYLRDPTTGVQFELEDMRDVREGSVLSLDIEPLDQVKQHVDQKFAAIMLEMKQELKDMKSSLEHSRRLSVMAHAPPHLTPSPAGSRPAARDASPFASPLAPGTVAMPSTDSAETSVRTPRKLPATEVQVRAQLDEIQSLRRDLAIMRQFHVDFLSETKEAFAKLRKENTAMRDLVKTKMGGSRAILDNSKVKLEVLCGETIQAVEEVLDVIEAAREDAFKRYVHPSRTQMAKIQANLKKANDLVFAFTAEVTSMEPTWRATWHLELSRVMEEQKLLPHQLKLAQDLKKDIKDGEEMFKNVSDFVDQRTTNAAKGLRSAYRPPTPDESGGGVQNLLMEIRTKESDPNQRLRAIEAQQRAREKEKANKTDEFQDELAGFVAGRKLKKTGGTDEVDRARQRKQDQTIRRMLSGSAGDMGSPTGLGILSPQMTGASVASFTSTGTAGTAMGAGLRTTSSASVRSEDGRKGES